MGQRKEPSEEGPLGVVIGGGGEPGEHKRKRVLESVRCWWKVK